MMTLEMVMAMVDALGDDASYSYRASQAVLAVTLEDFAGFDEDWDEVERDYDDEEAVDAFVEALEASALSVEGDFYRDYEFDGFTVQLGYASMDV